MSEALRILFTNNTLAKPAGTERSVLDYATSLLRRGHAVAAYSAHLGETAELLRSSGVVVVDDLNQTPWIPNLIHGHHEWETAMAALHFHGVPVISFCRGPYTWQEAPCRAPNVVLWAAVDEACRDRLDSEHGVPLDRIELVLNGVDLARFQQRPVSVTAVKRALIFSNYATEQNYVPAVRAACARAGVELSVIGAAVGCIHPTPHEMLRDFDLVFAKGKAALEAIAVGCAVVVCDTAGLGPWVTSANFDSLRRLSFGNPCMTEKITEAAIAERLSLITGEEAGRTMAIVRSTCGLERTIDHLEMSYHRALHLPMDTSAAKVAGYAASFMQARTHAFKLGRKTQEFWHNSRDPEAEDRWDAVKVDRVLDAFFNAETKHTRLTEKLEKAQIEVEKLRKGEKPRRGLRALLQSWMPQRQRGDDEPGYGS